MSNSTSNKTVYFVRHGESEQNSLAVFQDDATPLSKKGEEQARFLARRLSKLQVDIVFSSTLQRARKTAEIVGRELNLEIIFDELFLEIRKPKEIVGKPHSDTIAGEIWQKVWSHRFDPDWRYSTEENFSDRKARAKRVIEKILGCDKSHILIIAHGGIIRSTLAYMLFGDTMTPQEYYSFIAFLYMSNTGISICKYRSEGIRWQVTSWNDLAHLG